jgi:hypothetical protein
MAGASRQAQSPVATPTLDTPSPGMVQSQLLNRAYAGCTQNSGKPGAGNNLATASVAALFTSAVSQAWHLSCRGGSDAGTHGTTATLCLSVHSIQPCLPPQVKAAASRCNPNKKQLAPLKSCSTPRLSNTCCSCPRRMPPSPHPTRGDTHLSNPQQPAGLPAALPGQHHVPEVYEQGTDRC